MNKKITSWHAQNGENVCASISISLIFFMSAFDIGNLGVFQRIRIPSWFENNYDYRSEGRTFEAFCRQQFD